MRARRSLLALLGIALFWWGCGREAEPEDDIAAADPSFLSARYLFRTHCSACHGKNGRGASHLFPPLRGSPFMAIPPEASIRIVLHGLEGPLRVNGKDYLNKMAPLGARLNDSQIAEILTYLRLSWGNAGDSVSVAEVERVRKATADRDRSWTVEELEPWIPDDATGISGSEP